MATEVACTFLSIIPKLVKFVSNINCSLQTGVVLPKGCGKSTVCSNFYVDSDTILLDLEEAVRLSLDNDTLVKLDELRKTHQTTSFNSMFYIKCKEYVKSQRKAFPTKRYILFSSDKKLLEYVGTKKIFVFSPSDAMFKKIVTQMEEGVKSVAEKNRLDILLQQGRKALLVFNSFEELANLLAKNLDLKHVL
jgi:hypothetical protein